MLGILGRPIGCARASAGCARYVYNRRGDCEDRALEGVRGRTGANSGVKALNLAVNARRGDLKAG